MVGNSVNDLKLAVYSDASFAGDTGCSKSTTGGVLCLVGDKTFVPLNWICKKQGAVSHSSTEAEIIALDAVLRVEGVPCLNLWSDNVECIHPVKRIFRKAETRNESAYGRYDLISFEYMDWVPPSLPPLRDNGVQLVFVEDNDAVLKMCVKARYPNLKYCPRTHRVDLDWLFLLIKTDPCVVGRYIHTKLQIADLLRA